MSTDRTLTVGLITGRDLDVLAFGLKRLFEVRQDDSLAQLLAALSNVEPVSTLPGCATDTKIS